ncbi:MAG: tetratricopeptide repeat protein [Flavobacteriales bacterium]|nr:tetratricopeptide repeat protein [Flavobacteriales bacterium]
MSNKINPHHEAPVTESKDVDLGDVYTRTELFIENNKKAITIGVVGIIAVVGGLLGYKKFIAEPKAREAAEMTWKAEYYFEIDSLDKALNGDDQWPGFLTVAEDYSGTPSGNLAQYYLGAIYMQKGEFEAALDHYKKADLEDDVLRVMAIGNQGDALVELGRTDEAVKQFEKAAGMTNNELVAPMYLMKAGILHQQAANWSGAAKAFKRIATEFPNSPDANTARKYAGHAEAMGG